jgi:hypothetical protein
MLQKHLQRFFAFIRHVVTELYTVDNDPNLRKKSSKAKAYVEYRSSA